MRRGSIEKGMGTDGKGTRTVLRDPSGRTGRQITEEEKNVRVRGWEKAVRTSFDWAKVE